MHKCLSFRLLKGRRAIVKGKGYTFISIKQSVNEWELDECIKCRQNIFFGEKLAIGI